MKRAALLQCTGDPFILAYWLRNYELVWKDEVDELRVFVNGPSKGPVLDYCHDAVERLGGIFTSQGMRLVHGQATEILLGQTDADQVLLIEDDAFVRIPGAVADAFDQVTRYGCVIGSPRGGMSGEVEQAAIAKWGSPQPVGPDGGSGYGLWPCFLIGPHPILEAVGHGIESLTWETGEVIPGVEYTCPARMTTDTATLAAFILRGSGVPLAYEGQWKELWMKKLPEMQELAGYDPPWFHSGGLSNELFYDAQDRAWNDYALGARPDIGGSNEGLDWAHRLWWWWRCVDSVGDDLPDVQALYRERLEVCTRMMDVEEQLNAWTDDLLPWITWDDDGR